MVSANVISGPSLVLRHISHTAGHAAVTSDKQVQALGRPAGPEVTSRPQGSHSNWRGVTSCHSPSGLCCPQGEDRWHPPARVSPLRCGLARSSFRGSRTGAGRRATIDAHRRGLGRSTPLPPQTPTAHGDQGRPVALSPAFPRARAGRPLGPPSERSVGDTTQGRPEGRVVRKGVGQTTQHPDVLWGPLLPPNPSPGLLSHVLAPLLRL